MPTLSKVSILLGAAFGTAVMQTVVAQAATPVKVAFITVDPLAGPISFNDGTVMVSAGSSLKGPGEVYPKQTGFLKGVVGNIKG